MARILIAEDDTSMRNFLSLALEKAGHEVEACTDGFDALKAVTASCETDGQPFDLLLADIVMPGMDGIELSQRAAQLQPALKVMFITGFAAVALARQTPGTASAHIMSKPFHLKDLVDQVETLLAAAA